jgi:hypothetical protein
MTSSMMTIRIMTLVIITLIIVPLRIIHSAMFYLKSIRSFRLFLDDEVDGGIVAAEGVGGHAGEEGGVAAFGPLDADGGQDPVGLNLLSNCIPARTRAWVR